MQPGVTVVLVNWNGEKYLRSFLPKLFETTYPNFDVLLVDNASADGSLAFVREQYPQIKVVETGSNLGFAAGNNFALPYVETQYVLLLNTDVEVTPGWLEPLVQLMEARPETAAVQPKVLSWHDKTRFEYAGASGGWLDAKGYAFCRGRVFDVAETDAGQYDDAAEIFWATGACMMIRRSVIDQLGLFDPKFFAHWEEIDFCWRARNAGYSIWAEPRSVVYHVGGGTLPVSSPRKTRLNFRNSLLAFVKNLPAGQAFGKVFFRMILDGVAAWRALLKGDAAFFGAVFKAHLQFYGMLGYAIRQRKGMPKKNLEAHAGVFRGSVVYQHFVKGKQYFWEMTGQKAPKLPETSVERPA